MTQTQSQTQPQLNEGAQALRECLMAAVPFIWITSSEEARVEDTIRDLAAGRGASMYCWDVASGVTRVRLGATASRSAKIADIAKMKPPMQALAFPGKVAELYADEPDPAKRNERMVYVLRDFHPYLGDPAVVREMRNLARRLPALRTQIVILSPVAKIPPELEKEICLIDWPLPTREVMSEALASAIRSSGGADHSAMATVEGRSQVVDALMGLTLVEAENALSKSLATNKRLDPGHVLGEKRNVIKKSGALEYYQTDASLAEIGGLDQLKGWLRSRRRAFSPRARELNVPMPKGLLLVGVPGCGKSAIAKAIGAAWRMPVLRLDMGKMFGSLVGASESNIRTALKTAEAVAPCVLWIDEIEKGLAGMGSSDKSDGGTAARVFSTVLTWMQDKTTPVFVVATANEVRNLPPELLRKGRFDELFFVDLPTPAERAEIFKIHVARSKFPAGEIDYQELAAAAKDFSGAECEQAVISGIHEAFGLDEQDPRLDTGMILAAARATVPLAQSMGPQLAAMREWARTNARTASTAEARCKIPVMDLSPILGGGPRPVEMS